MTHTQTANAKHEHERVEQRLTVRRLRKQKIYLCHPSEKHSVDSRHVTVTGTKTIMGVTSRALQIPTYLEVVQSVAADGRLTLRPALVREHPERLDPFRLGFHPPSQSVQVGTNRPPVFVSFWRVRLQRRSHVAEAVEGVCYALIKSRGVRMGIQRGG